MEPSIENHGRFRGQKSPERSAPEASFVVECERRLIVMRNLELRKHK